MKDADTHLQEIKDRVLAFAKERDWEQFHAPKNLSMAIAAEAAELMEHFFGRVQRLLVAIWKLRTCARKSKRVG